MENNETDNLINNLSDEQIQRIADRIKVPKKPIPIDPVKLLINYGTPIADNKKEVKDNMDFYYRENLKIILKNLYSTPTRMSKKQLAFVDEIKNKFVQDKELPSIEELAQLNKILKSVNGSCLH